GAATERPAVAFALGVASHFALDAVPHWGDWGDDKSVFMRVAVRDGLTGLAIMGVLTALDKPSRIYFGFSPFPRAVDDFHSGIQRESRRRFPVEVATGVACLATLAVL